MAKVKPTGKELPFINRDLGLDETTVKKLVDLQNEYRVRFETHIKAAESETFERYNSKLDSLTKSKEKMLKEHDAEISRYQELVKDLKVREPAKTASPKTPQGVKSKKATPPKKKK